MGRRARLDAANADSQRFQSAQHRASPRFRRAAPVRVRLGAGDDRRAAARSRRVFVVRLPPDAARGAVACWVERYRALLAAESGVAFPPTAWEIGFRAALCELLVDRLSFYAMIDRVRPQRFLGRGR